MNLTTKVTRITHIKYWIKLWNGNLNLTNKEEELLSEILYRIMELKDNGLEEPYISDLAFSIKSMGEIKDKLNLSKQSLFNYKKGLINKGVLIKTETGIKISQKMIPCKTVTFKFDYGE